MQIRLPGLLLTLLALPLGCLAGSYESHDHIREVARQHALQRADRFPGHIEITTGQLDRRLRLAACDTPPERL